jgi:hypothetical protein
MGEKARLQTYAEQLMGAEEIWIFYIEQTASTPF